MAKKITGILVLFISINIFSQTTVEWYSANGGSENETVYGTFKTSDGGYIALGGTYSGDYDIDTTNRGYSDAFIIKYDSLGNNEWLHTYGGESNEIFTGVCEANDGGYIILGQTSSVTGDLENLNYHGDNDLWVLKIDSLGNIVWNYLYGGSLDEFSKEIIPANDGGFIILANTKSDNGDVSNLTGGYVDAWIMKINNDGGILWEKTYGGTNWDILSKIKSTSNGYVVAGETRSNTISGFNGDYDVYLLKIDNNGNTIWEKAFGGSNTDQAFSLDITSNYSYIIGGRTNSNDSIMSSTVYGNGDAFVMKIDSSGNFIWETTLGGSEEDVFWGICATANNQYFAVGQTESDDFDITSDNCYNHGYIDGFYALIDDNGNKQFSGTLGGNGNDILKNAYYTFDGNYITIGETKSSYGDINNSYGDYGASDIVIAKFNNQNYTEITKTKEKHINIYPNPASNYINIDIDNINEIQIIDMCGKTVLIENSVDKTIDVSKLNSGLYTIKIIAEKNIYSNKIIINNF